MNKVGYTVAISAQIIIHTYFMLAAKMSGDIIQLQYAIGIALLGTLTMGFIALLWKD